MTAVEMEFEIPEPDPEPEPEPQPEPEPEPEPETGGGGIPGFPIEAILLGLVLIALLGPFSLSKVE